MTFIEWVQQAYQECAACTVRKAHSERTTPMTITTTEPFELVTMDFLTVSSSHYMCHYVLDFVDHIKFSVIVLTKDQTAMNTARLFREHQSATQLPQMHTLRPGPELLVTNII